jgi:hypothetical protein
LGIEDALLIRGFPREGEGIKRRNRRIYLDEAALIGQGRYPLPCWESMVETTTGAKAIALKQLGGGEVGSAIEAFPRLSKNLLLFLFSLVPTANPFKKVLHHLILPSSLQVPPKHLSRLPRLSGGDQALFLQQVHEPGRLGIANA